MAGIANNKGLKSFAVNGISDHVHLFLGFNPSIKLSDFVRDLKHFSSIFIKERKFLKSQFNWQIGFGAFTHSQSQIDRIVKYIMNQEKHHKKKSFEDEYFELLDKFEVKYDKKYVLG
jgi:REP element-mobilizing transposase RayT